MGLAANWRLLIPQLIVIKEQVLPVLVPTLARVTPLFEPTSYKRCDAAKWHDAVPKNQVSAMPRRPAQWRGPAGTDGRQKNPETPG
jgi:hypothetical protein